MYKYLGIIQHRIPMHHQPSKVKLHALAAAIKQDDKPEEKADSGGAQCFYFC